MKIGVLGSATVGMTLATRLAKRGHDVLIANSRGPESLLAALREGSSDARPAAATEVLRCDVVFLAVPWTKVADALPPALDWDSRILVDTTNIFLSYAPDYRVDDLKGDSGSEIVARIAPTARVVKAFNTLPFSLMFSPAPEKLRRVLFVAGDEEDAVSTVSGLIDELGLHPVALGSLAQAGRQMELGGTLSIVELFAPINSAAS